MFQHLCLLHYASKGPLHHLQSLLLLHVHNVNTMCLINLVMCMVITDIWLSKWRRLSADHTGVTYHSCHMGWQEGSRVWWWHGHSGAINMTLSLLLLSLLLGGEVTNAITAWWCWCHHPYGKARGTWEGWALDTGMWWEGQWLGLEVRQEAFSIIVTWHVMLADSMM